MTKEFQWFSAAGRSMWPLAAPLELGVTAVPSWQLQVGDVVAVVGQRPGTAIFHRIVAIHGELLQTRGDTQHRVDPLLPRHAVIGRVEAIRLNSKEISLPVHGLPARWTRRLGLAWGQIAPNLRDQWRRVLQAQRRP